MLPPERGVRAPRHGDNRGHRQLNGTDAGFSTFIRSLGPRRGVFMHRPQEITHDALPGVVAALEAAITEKGIAPGHRIGLLLRDGPTALLLPLTLIHRARVLPMNPALTAAEIRALVTEARLDAVVTDEETAEGLTDTLGDLPVLRIEGTALSGAALAPPERSESPGLLLLTSGSTGTPKRVFLRPDQLIGSARTIGATLALTPEDCAVHALPTFHVGALVDLCLAPLVTGGALRVAPGPTAQDIAATCRAGATWVQMVPTMLAACMAEWTADEARDIARRLRFLRSVSSDLSPEKQAEAEAFLGGTPIIQMYGLTEAAGQVASNPLPPLERRPGTVGQARGAEIAILSPDGHPVGAGRVGEVCLSGPNVTEGYEDVAPEEYRHGKWLRTGDLGVLDEYGFLSLRGRVKEMINRGGEKISALEVERAALAVPGVAEAAAFALPHPTLGEQVGLAVVPAAGKTPVEAEVLEGLAGSLAAFKCPRRVTMLDAMPRLGSGKIDKRTLAEGAEGGGVAPIEWTGEAATVADTWAAVLKAPRPAADDDFFDAGGDSLSATDFLSRLETALGRPVPPTLLFDAPRFADLLERLESGEAKREAAHPVLAHVMQVVAGWRGERIGPHGLIFALGTLAEKAPLFMCAQGRTRDMKAVLHPERPLYVMSSIRDHSLRTEENCQWLARLYADEIEALRPAGPLHLGGFCAGARQMRRVADVLHGRGREVALMLSIDHWFPRPSSYPVFHAATENRTYSAAIHYREPERALPILHPAGGALIRLGGDHGESIRAELMRPMGEQLERFIEAGELPRPAPAGLPFEERDRAHRAKIALHAPRMLRRDRDVSVRVTVTNTSEETWGPTEESHLTLAAHLRNLDGYARVPHVAHRHLDKAVGPGERHETELTVRYPGTGLPLLLEVGMVDEGIAAFGAARRLVWANPFTATQWIDR